MKKNIMSIILMTTFAMVLTACGSKNNVEVVSTNVVEAETVVSTESVTKTKEIHTNVPQILVGGWSDVEAWTVGGPDSDIEVLTGELENMIPEFSIMLPSKSHNYTIEARNYDGNKRTNETANVVLIDVTPTSKLEMSVHYWPISTKSTLHEARHFMESTSNYYIFDADWLEDKEHPSVAYITIQNEQNDCAIELRFVLTKIEENANDNTDYNAFIKSMIDYLSKQIDTLPNYSSSSNINENANEDIATQVWDDEAIEYRENFISDYYRQYTKDSGETIELIYNADNDYSLIICDEANTYECTLLEIGEGTYSATFNDQEIIQIYNDEPDVFEVYAIDDNFAYLNGYYK